MFEWVYFAGADSIIEGKSVYTSRLDLGKRLADRVQEMMVRTGWKPDIVCPVPDTSRPSTIALAEVLKVPYREVFIKNRYVQRSFILNTQAAREPVLFNRSSLRLFQRLKGETFYLSTTVSYVEQPQNISECFDNMEQELPSALPVRHSVTLVFTELIFLVQKNWSPVAKV